MLSTPSHSDEALADAVEAALQGNTLRDEDGKLIGSYKRATLSNSTFMLHGCSIAMTDWARDIFREIIGGGSGNYKSTLKLCEGDGSVITLEGAWVQRTADLTITIAFDQYTTLGM